MNLTKKGRIAAIITSFIICFAIIISACLIFTPNQYKNSDIEVGSTDYNPYDSYNEGDGNGYGMSSSVTFDSNNMALALAKNSADDHIWIYFPTSIYMDVKENLSTLGYYYRFYAHYGKNNDSDYHHLLFHAAMGYYKDNNGDKNDSYTNASNNNANMDNFFNDYDITPNIKDGAKKNPRPNDNWVWNQSGGDNAGYRITYYEGGKFISGSEHVRTDVAMSGTGKKGDYTFQRLSGGPIFAVRKYNWPNTNWQWCLTSTESTTAAQNYGKLPADLPSGVPILDDVKINIHIYDKSTLLDEFKTLKNKYNALDDAKLLLSTESVRFGNLNIRVQNMLEQREVTQSQIDTLTQEIKDYVFNTYIPTPDLGTSSDPQEVTYSGSAYSLGNFWIGYNDYIPGTYTRYAECFPSGTMDYALTGYDANMTPIDYDEQKGITEAGYYQVTFAPSEEGTVTAAGYNINVKFSWSDGSTNQKWSYLHIIPADIVVSEIPLVELTYKGDTHNSIKGLPDGVEITLVGSGNTSSVQLSIIERSKEPEKAPLAWMDVEDYLEFEEDVTDENIVVYFRITAKNHLDYFDSFEVKIKPADIEVKINSTSQIYYSTLLTSEDIFNEMLALDTPLILDSTDYAQTRAYLENILSFVILDSEDVVFAPDDKPNKGNYSIDAVKTSDETWSRRIGEITFVEQCNIDAYEIVPRTIDVKWTDNKNEWYDNASGHLPDVDVAIGEDKCNQEITFAPVKVIAGPVDGNQDAVSVGEYTAQTICTNYNFVIAQGHDTYDFEILPRKISIVMTKQTDEYASATAEDWKSKYVRKLQDPESGVYVATLNSQIAEITGKSNALADDFGRVFSVTIDVALTDDGVYITAGTHSLGVVLINNNYELENYVSGVYEVDKARFEVPNDLVISKTYNGNYQDAVLPMSYVSAHGYEAENTEKITVEYSSTGLDGSWSTAPLRIKDVKDSPITVHYKLSADNHYSYTSSFEQKMAALEVEVIFDGQGANVVYYGSKNPTSQELIDICGIRFDVNTMGQEGSGIETPDETASIDVASIFEFYIVNPNTNQTVLSIYPDAGKYTVKQKLNATIDEDENNFNVSIIDNVEAYTVSAKPLNIIWAQEGDRWTEGGDHYIFSNSTPTVFPKADPNSIVEGDEINLDSIELEGSTVNKEGYRVKTELTTERNGNNYVISEEEAWHTFYIDPLEVDIAIKSQTAQYGQSHQVPLGELTDSKEIGALWYYPEGSVARFYSNHYANWKFALKKNLSDENTLAYGKDTLLDVGEYYIVVADNTDAGKSIRDNYNVTIVNDAKLEITTAQLRFSGITYDIAYDEGEDTVITKDMLIKRITTGLEDKGVLASDSSMFNVFMSQKDYRVDDNIDLDNIDVDNIDWVDATDEEGLGEYYILLYVTSKNFDTFAAKIQLNIKTKWVSIEIGGGISAQYGYSVSSSEDIFDGLDILKVTGLFRDGKPISIEEAKDELKKYVELYVDMLTNERIGDYPIYFRVKENDEYQNFRFLNDSNIKAYHVVPRTLSVDWDNMDSTYGNQINASYKIVDSFGNDGVLEKDKDSVRLEIVFDTLDNTANLVAGRPYTVGTYTAKVVSVNNPNYMIDPNDSKLTNTFKIDPRVINIILEDRSFVYGVDNARIDSINNALNAFSQTPHYTADNSFVEPDKRTDIFDIYFESMKSIDSKLAYLPVGNTYIINAKIKEDSEIARNYMIHVSTATLEITPASLSFNAQQFATLYFNAQKRFITSERDRIIVAGDAEYIRNNATISYRIKSRDEDTNFPTDFVNEGKFSIKDAGNYVIEVLIEADNHVQSAPAEVSLNVLPANVVINMSQKEKIYGYEIDCLSDWLKTNCGISITSSRDGSDITEYAIDDFIFYVVDPDGHDKGDDNMELQPGLFQHNVGEYRVYHKINTDEGALDGNYIVEYYQACNDIAYKIIPKQVEVTWTVSDENNWIEDNSKYYYTGNTPGLVATFYALADINGEIKMVTLDILGIENVNVNKDGQRYTAQVDIDSWKEKEKGYATNYELTNDSHTYTIIKRPIEITIKNQDMGKYGSVKGKDQVATAGKFSVKDLISGQDITQNIDFTGDSIKLTLDNKGIGADELLPYGEYNIIGSFKSDNSYNYEVSFVGENGNEYGVLSVGKADFNFSRQSYDQVKYLGEDFSIDIKDVLGLYVNSSAFVENDDWMSAWENARISVKQNGIEVDSPIFSGAGEYTVEYTIYFENYYEFHDYLDVDVQKANLNVSIVVGASSVYGDGLLKSEDIFKQAQFEYLAGSDMDIKISLSDIIELYVDENAVNVGTYNIEKSYINNQDKNFNVEFFNYDKYEITKREVVITWSMDDTDTTLGSDGNYEYDGAPHKIKYEVGNIVNGDKVEIIFNNTELKDQADTYIATAELLSIASNDNYQLNTGNTYSWTINPKAIEITWIIGEYIYDGTEKAPMAKVDAQGLIEGTSCGVRISGGKVNVGTTYTATAEATSKNYTIINNTATFEIKPKTVEVIWSNETFVYDGRAHKPTATVKASDLVGAENVQVYVSGEQINAGENYRAIVTGLSDGNYQVAEGTSTTFSIAKKEVTIHWTDTQFDYTGEQVLPNGKLEGVLGDDSVELEISGGQSDVGTYRATATGVTNGNYVLASNTVKNMNYTINKVNNEFDGLFGNGDSKTDFEGIPWLDNKPTNKFGGEVIIKYYDDEACTKEIDINKVKDGTYWAKAYVKGTDNYNELESAPLKFTIDKGINIGVVLCGIIISVILLGGVLAVILVINGKKKKGGNV